MLRTRPISGLSIVALVALTLAGCGGSNDTTSDAPSTAPATSGTVATAPAPDEAADASNDSAATATGDDEQDTAIACDAAIAAAEDVIGSTLVVVQTPDSCSVDQAPVLARLELNADLDLPGTACDSYDSGELPSNAFDGSELVDTAIGAASLLESDAGGGIIGVSGEGCAGGYLIQSGFTGSGSLEDDRRVTIAMLEAAGATLGG